MVKEYYYLAKPGLVYGNLVTVIAGFLLGSVFAPGGFAFTACFAVMIGIALVMGSGCVFNNIIDRDIDAVMARTKKRPVVVGKISRQNALIYGILLGLIGLAFIAIWTNFLTVLLGIAGWLAYVVLYTRAKRHTTWSTVLGSISGAIPPVVGYAAASGRLDLAAFLLFLILVIWQMPHFYAIGIYRYDDYKAAGIPIVPVREGISRTKRTMFLYIFAFAIVAPLLAVYGYVGATYFIISLACGIAWLGFSIAGFWVKNDAAWARKMFYLSILVMTILFFTIAINSLISVFYAGTR